MTLLIVTTTLQGCGDDDKCPEDGGVPIANGKVFFKCDENGSCFEEKRQCNSGYGDGVLLKDIESHGTIRYKINKADNCVIKFVNLPNYCHKCDEVVKNTEVKTTVRCAGDPGQQKASFHLNGTGVLSDQGVAKQDASPPSVGQPRTAMVHIRTNETSLVPGTSEDSVNPQANSGEAVSVLVSSQGDTQSEKLQANTYQKDTQAHVSERVLCDGGVCAPETLSFVEAKMTRAGVEVNETDPHSVPNSTQAEPHNGRHQLRSRSRVKPSLTVSE